MGPWNYHRLDCSTEARQCSTMRDNGGPMPRHASPLSAEDGPLAAFALELRALRDAMGPTAPTPDKISSKQRIHRATIYAALQGKRLPTRDVLASIVASWGGNQTEWMAKRSKVENALAIARKAVERPRPRSEPKPRRGITWGDLQQAGLLWGDLEDERRRQNTREERIAAFTHELEQLRQEHGWGLRTLAKRIEDLTGQHLAFTSLHSILTGRSGLPSQARVAAIVYALTEDQDQVDRWRAKWTELQR